MSLGLRRHTVREVPHDPEWAALGIAECASIRRVLGALAIEVRHVGSTAVTGLPAKPILDVALAVETQDVVPEITRRAVGIGYRYRCDGGDQGGHLLVKEPEPDVRTVHLHVVAISDPQWVTYLAFRDRLRSDAGLRRRYARLKLRLAERYPNDRRAYTAEKDAFVREVLTGN